MLQYGWRHYGKWNKPVINAVAYIIPLTWDAENGQFQRDRKWNGGCQGFGGGENRELLVNGDRLSVLDDEESLEMDGGDGCPAMWVYWSECHWTVQQGKNRKFVYFTPI